MVWSAALTLAALVARGAAADPAVLAIPKVHADRAAALVARLGDRQFPERDAAYRELEAMGRLALPAVRAGRMSADAEVRQRCGRLSPVMETDDLGTRLMVFVADADGRYDHRVPGWELFRSAAGDTRPARDLFAAVTRDRANWPLLAALRGPGVEVRTELLALAGGPAGFADRPPPARAAQAAAVRRWEFFAARTAPTLEDDDAPPVKRPRPQAPEIALVLLAETLHPERMNTRNGRHEIDANSLLNDKAGNDALLGQGRYGPAFARLGRVWMDTRDGNGILYAYNLAKNIKLDPATVGRYAARVVGRRDMPVEGRAECASRLARDRQTDHLGVIVGGFGETEGLGDGLLRDHLLAAAVVLTGQRPDDYGFRADPNRGVLFVAPQALFVAPEGTKPKDVAAVVAAQRAAAFDRWRNWEATTFGAAAGPLGAVARLP